MATLATRTAALAFALAVTVSCVGRKDQTADDDASSGGEEDDPSGDQDHSATGGVSAGGSQNGRSAGGTHEGGAGAGGTSARAPVAPSPGCSAGKRSTGGRVLNPSVSIIDFPESYDGHTPFPVLFGFHDAGGDNRGDGTRSEYTDLVEGTAFATGYVRAIPLSAGWDGFWSYAKDIDRVKALRDTLAEDYCIDLNRVFASGHGWGGAFLEYLLVESQVADVEYLGFAALAPIASQFLGPHGIAMPVLYIANPNDTVTGFSNAEPALELFREGNACEESSSGYPVAGCESGSSAVEPGCITYDGCDVPTIWCSHDDPIDDGHGVPCFAMSAMHAFFGTF